jgi:vacuolar-type H+-ATPase subunit E/Vma4
LVDNESVDRICSRIRDDGEKEIESILEKARQTGDDIVAKVNRAGEEAAGKILKEAREKGEIARKRLLSSVNLEVKRAKLKAREEIVSAVHERVGKALAAYRKSGDYASVMTGLVLEAVSALEGDSFIVWANAEDIDLVEGTVFPAVLEAVQGKGRRVSKLEAKPFERPTSGGVQVGVPDGNVIYDNTFEARLYRLREEIRNIIFEEVFSSGESEEPGSA